MGSFLLNWRWTVPRRLLLAFTVLAGVICASLAATLYTFAHLRESMAQVAELVEISQEIDEMAQASIGQISAIRSLLLTGERENVLRFWTAAARFNETQERLAARELPGTMAEELGKLDRVVETWRAETAEVQIALMRNPWTADTAKAFEALGRGTQFIAATETAVGRLRELERQTVLRALDRALSALSSTEMLVLGGAVFALIFAAAAWIYLSRAIVHPLTQIGAAMERIEKYEENATIPLQGRRDEFGTLARGLSSLLGALGERSNRLKSTLGDLRQAQRQLVEKERLASLGGLVAGLSHEVNTPLGIARTSASNLEEVLKDLETQVAEGTLTHSGMLKALSASRESADLALRNIARAGDLMRSFKSVAADQSENRRRYIRLKPYLEEVLLSLSPHIKLARASARIDCEEEIGLVTDPGALSQILTNLVTNSLTHGFEKRTGGEIKIAAAAAEDGIQLVYMDNGEGIEPSDRQRIFDPFFTTKRGRGSSGLGLHIVYNIVTGGLGGTIEAESARGIGTRFLICLPSRAGGEAEVPDMGSGTAVA